MVPGAIFDSHLLSEDEVTVSDFYQDRGHWKIQVSTDVQKVPGAGIEISYDLKTGDVARIRSVVISGNRKTRESLILRRISVNPGDLLTRLSCHGDSKPC